MIRSIKNFLRNSIYSRRSGISRKLKSKSILKSKDLKYFVKSFGNKNPNKRFYVIQRFIGGGMFSNLNYIIHHLKLALDLNCIPIIDMENFPTKYNEKYKINNTKNAWEYYFYPLNKYKLSEVYKSKFVIISDKKTRRLKEFDTFEALSKKHFKIFKKHIKIRQPILDDITKFFNNNFKKNNVLGVHFRGTDMKTQERHPFPATTKQIISLIEKSLKKGKFTKIFLVTEELNYQKILKKKYGSMICFYNSFRSNNPDIFGSHMRKNHRYLIGRENIIDMILLSKVKKIICTNSHLPDASKFINNLNKINLLKIDNGNNSENLLIAQFLWYLKKNIPQFLGGFKKF
tara:strand:- start:5740 stop:6774 length:1035 start_codon:yes stop_codon:yes gene_type:complete